MRAISRRNAAAVKRHAAGGRRKARPGHVHEHGAAAAGDPRPGVVVELDDEIVETVGAPEPVAGMIGLEPERLVVVAVARVFAPAVVAAGCGRDRQVRARPRRAVGAPPQPPSRNVPRGVPPSPSRLLARMPPRPSATGSASGPASSQPRVRCPGLARTRRLVSNEAISHQLANGACSFIPECSISRKVAGLWPYNASGGPGKRCPTAARS